MKYLWIVLFVLVFSSCEVLNIAAIASNAVVSEEANKREKEIEYKSKYGNCIKQRDNLYDCSENKKSINEEFDTKESLGIILINFNPAISNKFIDGIEEVLLKNKFRVIKSRCITDKCMNNIIYMNKSINNVIMIDKLSIKNSIFTINGKFIKLRDKKTTDLGYHNKSNDIFLLGEEFSNYILNKEILFL